MAAERARHPRQPRPRAALDRRQDAAGRGPAGRQGRRALGGDPPAAGLGQGRDRAAGLHRRADERPARGTPGDRRDPGPPRGRGDARGAGARRLLAADPRGRPADPDGAGDARLHAALARGGGRDALLGAGRRRPGRAALQGRLTRGRHRRRARLPRLPGRAGRVQPLRRHGRAALELRGRDAHHGGRAGRGRQRHLARRRRRGQGAALQDRHHRDQGRVPRSASCPSSCPSAPARSRRAICLRPSSPSTATGASRPRRPSARWRPRRSRARSGKASSSSRATRRSSPTSPRRGRTATTARTWTRRCTSATTWRRCKHSPVPAANSGVVVFAGPLSIYGNAVVVDHGLGLQTLYAHLSSIAVKEGDQVDQGAGARADGEHRARPGGPPPLRGADQRRVGDAARVVGRRWIRDHVGRPLREASLPLIESVTPADNAGRCGPGGGPPAPRRPLALAGR